MGNDNKTLIKSFTYINTVAKYYNNSKKYLKHIIMLTIFDILLSTAECH